MYHSKVEDLHHLVLRSKSSQEQNHNIRNFFEMCEEKTKKEFLELLKIEKEIENLAVEEVISRYRSYVLPSLICEHSL